MLTNDEIFEELMGYLEIGITSGFFDDDEVKAIWNLESMYRCQNN